MIKKLTHDNDELVGLTDGFGHFYKLSGDLKKIFMTLTKHVKYNFLFYNNEFPEGELIENSLGMGKLFVFFSVGYTVGVDF